MRAKLSIPAALALLVLALTSTAHAAPPIQSTSAVTGFACAIQGDNDVRCTWNQVAGSTGYIIQDSTNGSTAAAQYTVSAGTQTGYTIRNRNHTWYFRIQTRGGGPWSAWVQAPEVARAEGRICLLYTSPSPRDS